MKDVVRANFDASTDAYSRYEHRTGRFTALARLLVAEMSTRSEGPFDAVLDAGAGTGVSTQAITERANRSVALDISHEMLAQVTSTPRIEADFDYLPFTNDTFDAVGFTASLFLFPDPTVATQEATRVLRSGGVVGAVAPMGWVTESEANIFADLNRESRSPTGTEDIECALADACAITSGTWRFATTAENIRLFYSIPAMAARLYPRLETQERVERARDLFDTHEGTFEQRWRWIVGVVE